MNRKMTLRARGAKCGTRGTSEPEGDSCASRPCCFIREASASMPKPPPARLRNSRREDDRSTDPHPQSIASLQIDEGVQVEQGPAQLGQRGRLQELDRERFLPLRRPPT